MPDTETLSTPPAPPTEAELEYSNLDQSTGAAGRTLARWFNFQDRLTAQSDEAIEALDMAQFESALRSLARLTSIRKTLTLISNDLEDRAYDRLCDEEDAKYNNNQTPDSSHDDDAEDSDDEPEDDDAVGSDDDSDDSYDEDAYSDPNARVIPGDSDFKARYELLDRPYVPKSKSALPHLEPHNAPDAPATPAASADPADPAKFHPVPAIHPLHQIHACPTLPLDQIQPALAKVSSKAAALAETLNPRPASASPENSSPSQSPSIPAVSTPHRTAPPPIAPSPPDPRPFPPRNPPPPNTT